MLNKVNLRSEKIILRVTSAIFLMLDIKLTLLDLNADHFTYYLKFVEKSKTFTETSHEGANMFTA